MLKIFQRNWPLFILAALSFLFFAKLFIPQSKIFVTPEFGMSDLWHQNLPYRFLLKEALSQGRLPLWTDKIGMGFPLFAEGQVAALSLVNLIPTIFLPAVTSFNISFILIFLILSISTYLFVREIGISKEGAFLSAIALTFSARVVTQLNHPNILLTFAFLPLSLFLIEKYKKTKKTFWLFLLSFVLSQQVLSGHLQMAFYGWLLVGGFWVFSPPKAGSEFGKVRVRGVRRVIPLALAMSLALGLSAVQLLPSWEFIQNSNRAIGVAEEIDAFPFRLKHLLLFLRPTILGTPADASYPLNANKEGLFGENSVYIGLIPLALGGLGVFWGFGKKVKKGKKKEGGKILFWGLVLVFSLLLSFGRATPLFFIFKLPLMNFFRIPPRFLFFSVFALITLTGYGFDFAASLLRSSKLTPLFALCSLLFAFLDLFSFSYNYHPTVTAKDWIETPPATASCLQAQDKEFRIVDAGSDSLWNQIFWHYGWDGDTLSKYKNLRNSLFTNSSVYWNIKTAGVYSGVQLQNIKALFDVLKKEVTVAPDDGFVLSKKGVELLSYLNVRFFVSPVNLVADNFSLSFHADFQPPAQEFAVFENKNFLPRVRFVENLPDAKITNTSFSNQKIEISYEAPSDNRLLLVDTYYPGWRAFIDGKETKIFPADFYGKFILAPKGTHKVEFVYQPRSFRAGGFISLVSFLIWGSSVIVVVRSHKNLQFSIYNFQSISNHTIFN